ncbi:hypothetical protein ACFFKU_05565 [Kineococcus gynurae]|uniref:AtpZ/AtpI family protein n=1 Tax=Kineococcus gynurae TaxID=452979 RepID=A0ABV5LMX5_9ACTN
MSLHDAARAPRVARPDRASELTESVAWSITSYLIVGAGLGALAGWGVDRLIGTGFVVGIGLVVGKALTLYYLWLRYGTHDRAPHQRDPKTSSTGGAPPRTHDDVRPEELT